MKNISFIKVKRELLLIFFVLFANILFAVEDYSILSGCTDPLANNYNFYAVDDNKTCKYGFEINSSDYNYYNFVFQNNRYIAFETIRILNPFFLENESTNTSWDYIKENNDYNLFINNEYYTLKNSLFNIKKFLPPQPYYTDLSHTIDNNYFIFIEKYKMNFDTINDVNISLPAVISLNDYFQGMLYKNKIFSFKKSLIKSYYEEYKETSFITGGIILYETDFFSIELKGSITINGSLTYTKREENNQNNYNQDDINLAINQTQQFTLGAYIGDKLNITAQQNSQSDFDWQNTLLIEYQGYENDIIQEASIGNIGISLDGSQLLSVGMGKKEGLFGAKLVSKFGPLKISTIIGREKSIKNSKSITGGVSEESIPIYDYNFLKDKYFFVDTEFKNKFYPLNDVNSHTYYTNRVIKEFLLYKRKTSGTSSLGVQPGIAYVDPTNVGNNLDNGDNIDLGDWVKLEENIDYTVDRRLGYIRFKSVANYDMIAAHYTIGIEGDDNDEESSGTRVYDDECLVADDLCVYCLPGDCDFDYTEKNFEDGFQAEDFCLIGADQCDEDSIVETEYIERNGIEGYQNIELKLKLVKELGPSKSTSKTWHLMFKNVYSLGGSNIESSSLEVEIQHTKGPLGNETSSEDGNTFLHIFGLDKLNSANDPVDAGDGQIDLGSSSIINLLDGEIIFPFHMPFAYDDTPYGNNFPLEDDQYRYWGNPHPHLSDIFDVDLTGLAEGVDDEVPDITNESIDYESYSDGPSMYYDNSGTTGNQETLSSEHEFVITVKHSSTSSQTISLGFMVVENSETVLLNGATKLNRGTDYTIDYFSGTLTLISAQATSPTATINITYDTRELVSFDQKLLTGINFKYDINDFSYFFGGAYYYSQTISQQKVEVGYEPMENFMWNIGAEYSKSFEELTDMINKNTYLDFDKDIYTRFHIEYAQVFPNPNPLGKAYIDDFENSRLESSLQLSLADWERSSIPIISSGDPFITLPDSSNRIDMYYYNPHEEVKTTDIWDVDVNANNKRTRTLWLELDTNPNYIGNSQTVWSGITAKLSNAYEDQSKSKYVDLWMSIDDINDPDLWFNFDLGVISEDINDDGKLNKEDQPLSGQSTGNGTLDPDEDIGLDGCKDAFETGWGQCLDEEGPTFSELLANAGGDPSLTINIYTDPGDPNRDNFSYENESWIYNRINGTEGNGGRKGDSEDWNRDEFLNDDDSFYRISFQPHYEKNNYEISNESYVETCNYTNSALLEGWCLFRVPLKK